MFAVAVSELRDSSWMFAVAVPELRDSS